MESKNQKAGGKRGERKGGVTERRQEGTTTEQNPEPVAYENNWPRYLVITSPHDQRVPLSYLAVAKAIQGIATTAKSLKRLRAGSYLVEVDRPFTAKQLMETTIMANTEVKITAHRSLNSCKGVIRSSDLQGCTEEEMFQELGQQNVTHVRRIMTKAGRKDLKPTNAVILTFSTPQPPREVKMTNLNLQVCTYIPKPQRCFQCQKFGHGKPRCNGKLTCSRCSVEGHDDRECRNTPHCRNCQGDHPAYDRSCPAWAKEQEILRIKYTQNISITEAKKQLESRPTNMNYSTAVRTNLPPKDINLGKMRHMGTQTDIIEPTLTTHAQSQTLYDSAMRVEISTQTEEIPASIKEYHAIKDTAGDDSQNSKEVKNKSKGKDSKILSPPKPPTPPTPRYMRNTQGQNSTTPPGWTEVKGRGRGLPKDPVNSTHTPERNRPTRSTPNRETPKSMKCKTKLQLKCVSPPCLRPRTPIKKS